MNALIMLVDINSFSSGAVMVTFVFIPKVDAISARLLSIVYEIYSYSPR